MVYIFIFFGKGDKRTHPPPMALERRKKDAMDSLSGVIPKGTLTPGSEAWEAYTKTLSPMRGVKSLPLIGLSNSRPNSAQHPRTPTALSSGKSGKKPDSHFRDAGPLTLTWARSQLDQVRAICDRMVTSTGLIECLVIADLKCIGGHTEIVEVPLKSNELARAVWHHPAAMRLRSKLLAQHTAIPGVPLTADMNGTIAGFERAESPGASIEQLTSTLAEEPEWPTNDAAFAGTGMLSSDYDAGYGAKRKVLQGSRTAVMNDSLDSSQTSSNTYPVIDDWREHFTNESLSFESVSIWAEVKLAQLPRTAEENHIRLAGVCELLWVITERAITRFAPLMRLLLSELRANLYIEYSTERITSKAPKVPLASDSRMDSAHLLHLTPFSKLYGNIADQMLRMRAIIQQSRDEKVVAMYRRKAIEYAQKMALRGYVRLVLDKWKDCASLQRQIREQESLINALRDVNTRKGKEIGELRDKVKKLEESGSSGSPASPDGSTPPRSSIAAPPPNFGRGGRARRSQMPVMRGAPGAKPATCSRCEDKPATLCAACVEKTDAEASQKLEAALERTAELEKLLADEQQATRDALRTVAAMQEAVEAPVEKPPIPTRTTEDAADLIRKTAGYVAMSLSRHIGSPLSKRLKSKASVFVEADDLVTLWANIMASKTAADELKYGVMIDPDGTISKYLNTYYTLHYGKGKFASKRLNDMLYSLHHQWESHPRLAMYATLCGLNPTTCHTFSKVLAEICCLWYRCIVRAGKNSFAGEQAGLLTSDVGAFLVEHKLVMQFVRLPDRGAAPNHSQGAMYEALEMLLPGYGQAARDAEISVLRDALLSLPDIKDHRTHFKNFVDMDLVYDALLSWHQERAEREQRQLMMIYRQVDADMNGYLSWDETLQMHPRLSRADVTFESNGLLQAVQISELEKLWELLDLDGDGDESGVNGGSGEEEEGGNSGLPPSGSALCDVKFSIGAWRAHLRSAHIENDS